MQDAAGPVAALLQIMRITPAQVQDAVAVAAQPFEISRQRMARFGKLQKKMIGKLGLQLLHVCGRGH